jgi:hypothetical protein
MHTTVKNASGAMHSNPASTSAHDTRRTATGGKTPHGGKQPLPGTAGTGRRRFNRAADCTDDELIFDVLHYVDTADLWLVIDVYQACFERIRGYSATREGEVKNRKAGRAAV